MRTIQQILGSYFCVEDANENVVDDIMDHLKLEFPGFQSRYTEYIEKIAILSKKGSIDNHQFT